MINQNDILPEISYLDGNKITGWKLKAGLYMTLYSLNGENVRYFWILAHYTKTGIQVVHNQKRFFKKIGDHEFGHWDFRNDNLTIQVSPTNTTRMSLEWIEDNIGVQDEVIRIKKKKNIRSQGYSNNMKNPFCWNGGNYNMSF